MQFPYLPVRLGRSATYAGLAAREYGFVNFLAFGNMRI
jgi:hypothetical protein